MPVDRGQVRIQVDAALHLFPGVGKSPASTTLAAGSPDLTAPWKIAEEMDVLLRVRLPVPEVREVGLVPQLPPDDRLRRDRRMRRPEGPPGAIPFDGGPDEGPELVEMARTRAGDSSSSPPTAASCTRSAAPERPAGGLADELVVVAPVEPGGRARLNCAPDEVDAEGPDPAVAHPRELGGGRVLRRHHAIERARGACRLRLRCPGRERQEGDQRPERNGATAFTRLGGAAGQADERVPGGLRVEGLR